MWRFIVKRLIAMVPVLIGVTLLVFIIMSFAPGDPARMILGEGASSEDVAALRLEMGLDDPVIVQYVRYLGSLMHGDLGTSYKTKTSVAMEIFSRFPNTVELAVVSVAITVILAIPLGIIAAVKQNSLFDTISMIIALIGISMPVFWLGLLLILFFSLQLGWLPASGADGLRSLILPALTLGLIHMALIARVMRSSMLEVIRQDYIRTARAKGLANRVVIVRHALNNAMLPTMTMIGILIGQLLGGSVVTETVFAWPGVGRYMVQSIGFRDMPAVLGCIIVFAVVFSLVNLIIDILYGFIDPRIKGQYK